MLNLNCITTNTAKVANIKASEGNCNPVLEEIRTKGNILIDSYNSSDGKKMDAKGWVQFLYDRICDVINLTNSQFKAFKDIYKKIDTIENKVKILENKDTFEKVSSTN